METDTQSGTKLLGGLAAVVLGILALLGVAPGALLSVSIIVLGAAFLLSSAMFVGLAGIVLGILAVVGIVPLTLVLVGALCLGAGALLSGGEIAATSMAH